MSDRVTKARKPDAKLTNDADKQRERKRALDRKAQRVSREKTKSYITHLENMLQILGGNEATPTTKLMEENTELRAEIDRLRKVIDSIKAILGVGVLEALAPRPAIQEKRKPSPSQSLSSSPRPTVNDACIHEIDSPPPNELLTSIPPKDISWALLPASDIMPFSEHTTTSLTRPESHSYMRTFAEPIDESTVPLNPRWDGIACSGVLAQQRLQDWYAPNVYRTVLDPPPPNFKPCSIFKTTNKIFTQVLFHKQRSHFDTDDAMAGSLIKAVKEGWSSLSFRESNNPVVQILNDLDRLVFWNLDPVTKLANLYKTLLILKYRFKPHTQNLENMPEWQRPTQAQSSLRYPVPLEYLPWPALRNRMIRDHIYYFAFDEFCIQYRQSLSFVFPHSFEHTYMYDTLTGTYVISPLFDMYFREVGNWVMTKEFLDKYPELRCEVPVLRESNIVSEVPDDRYSTAPFQMGKPMTLPCDHRGTGNVSHVFEPLSM